ELKEKLNITSKQLHKNSPDFNQTINKIKKANNYLQKNELDLMLPLIKNQFLNTNIKLLKHHFFFEKLPPAFVIEKESPDPELILLLYLF
ncbi:4305_t:CDS:2, partial [Acaulospora colombiana]